MGSPLDPLPVPRPARRQSLRLTKTAVERLPFEARRPDGKPKQRLYMDAELPGFGLLVGTATKTFIAQRDIDGRTRRVTLGRYGVLTVAQAREQARQLIAEMARGIDPTQVKRAKRATQASLREVLEAYLFTGLRREEAAALRWQAVDLAARTLLIPTTKSGRSLTLPLSDFLVELLAARRARYSASPWVFPAASRAGHIAEPRSGLDQVAQATDLHPPSMTCAAPSSPWPRAATSPTTP